MAFTESWVETDPDGSVITVSLLDDHTRQTKRALRERIEGDPAVLGSGLYEAGTFGTTAMVKKGVARAFTVTNADLTTTYLQDGRLAVNTDSNRLYHSRGSGLVPIKLDAADIIGGTTPSTFAALTVTPGVSSLQAITGTTLTLSGHLAGVSASFTDPSLGNTIAALPTHAAYTGAAFRSVATRASSSAFFHFFASSAGATISYIRGDGFGYFANTVTSDGGFQVGGNVAAPEAGIGRNAVDGLVLRGYSGGATYSFALTDPTNNYILRVPAGGVAVTFLGDTVHRNGMRLEAANDPTSPRIQSYSSKTLYFQELGNPVQFGTNVTPIVSTFYGGIVVASGNLTVSVGTSSLQALTTTTIGATGTVSMTTGSAYGFLWGSTAGGGKVWGWYQDNTGAYLRNQTDSNAIALGISNAGIVTAYSSLTVTGSATFDTGANEDVLIRQASNALTYNLISINGQTSYVNAIGLFGRAADAILYLAVPIGGAYQYYVGGANVLTISNVGALTANSHVIAAAGSALGWSGRSNLASSADGIITLTDNAGTAFTRLTFGGTTNAFPALRRTGAVLEAVVADASAWAVINAHSFNAQVGSSAFQGVTSTTLSASSSLQVGGGATITKILTGSVSWDPPSLANLQSSTTTATVTGAAVGDPCFVQSQFPGNTQMIVTAYVSAADTVTLVVMNHSGGALDPAADAVTFKVIVFKV